MKSVDDDDGVNVLLFSVLFLMFVVVVCSVSLWNNQLLICEEYRLVCNAGPRRRDAGWDNDSVQCGDLWIES